MAPQSQAPGACDAKGSDIVLLGSLDNPENFLDARRAQYLSEVFSLPPDTASLLAELAFGEVRQ